MFQLPPNISYNAKWHIGLDAPEAVVINCSFHAASMYCMGWLYQGFVAATSDVHSRYRRWLTQVAWKEKQLVQTWA